MEGSKIDFEALYTSIINSIDDGILSKTLDGKITSWNVGAEKIFGYTAKEAIGKNISIIIPPHLQEEESGIIKKISRGEYVDHYETARIRKDGTPIYVSLTITPIKDSLGNVIGASKISRDITEQKNAEFALKAKVLYTQKRLDELEETLLKYSVLDFSEPLSVSGNDDEWDEIAIGLNTLSQELQSYVGKLKKSHELFENLFEHNPAAIVISRMKDAQLIKVNKSFLSYFEFSSKEEVLGKTARELNIVAKPEHREEMAAILKKNKIIKNFEMEAYTKYGNPFWISTSMLMVEVDNEPCLFSISIDISNRKIAEDQLQAVNKELESFSYSVSHDLRAPLRAVNGYAKMLEEDYSKLFDEEGKRLLSRIQYNAEKMGKLIDDLLAFSRMGKKELQKTDINMEELAEAAVIEVNKSAPHTAKIKLGKLIHAEADYALMNQVFVNLISNAVKYSSKVKAPVIDIRSEKKDGNVIYSIHDNGIGFDMQYAHKLFGVFQRLHKTEEFEGTGVGLALVQRIINKHGGKIWVEAKPNEGANFFFSLPLKDQSIR